MNLELCIKKNTCEYLSKKTELSCHECLASQAYTQTLFLLLPSYHVQRVNMSAEGGTPEE